MVIANGTRVQDKHGEKGTVKSSIGGANGIIYVIVLDNGSTIHRRDKDVERI